MSPQQDLSFQNYQTKNRQAESKPEQPAKSSQLLTFRVDNPVDVIAQDYLSQLVNVYSGSFTCCFSLLSNLANIIMVSILFKNYFSKITKQTTVNFKIFNENEAKNHRQVKINIDI